MAICGGKERLVAVIRVKEQPEPQSFEATVRRQGLNDLKSLGIDGESPLPTTVTLKPYWRHCLDDLYDSYAGICAYLAVHFERQTGAGSVDHFVAKSSKPAMAYEWKNYRLACTRMNSCKREFSDVLDPFEVENGWFHLELVSGRVFPSPWLSRERSDAVVSAIARLGLDEPGCREMRARHYQEYRQALYNEEFLRRRSPFVWMEAKRQDLL